MILSVMLTTQIATAGQPDVILKPGQPAPFMGALSSRENYEASVASKKKLPLCEKALERCAKAVEFPKFEGPVRDAAILGVTVTAMIAIVVSSLAGH